MNNNLSFFIFGLIYILLVIAISFALSYIDFIYSIIFIIISAVLVLFFDLIQKKYSFGWKLAIITVLLFASIGLPVLFQLNLNFSQQVNWYQDYNSISQAENANFFYFSDIKIDINSFGLYSYYNDYDYAGTEADYRYYFVFPIYLDNNFFGFAECYLASYYDDYKRDHQYDDCLTSLGYQVAYTYNLENYEKAVENYNEKYNADYNVNRVYHFILEGYENVRYNLNYFYFYLAIIFALFIIFYLVLLMLKK